MIPSINRLAGACLFSMCSLIPATVAAQVRGVVYSENESPLPAALVEIWSSEGRLATQSTDSDGAFLFLIDVATVDRLTVKHLGHHSITLLQPAPDLDLRISLKPLAIPLPELSVSVARQACPNVEDESARSLWAAARARYSAATSERAMSVSMLRAEESLVVGSAIGYVDEARLRSNSSWWVGATPTPQPGRFHDVNNRIAASGYAARTDLSDPPWRFIALDGRDSHHFASDLFAEKHTLSVFREDGGEAVVAFCPVSRLQPWIEGTITIAADSSILQATWSHTTPRPVRQAGGEVTFGAWYVAGEALPHLLPTHSLFWVQHDKWKDRYYHRYTVYLQWKIEPVVQ